MKAMLLAAGRGERLRPLTDKTPKPLLKVGEHSLIEHHLLRLADCGVTDIVINVAWLGQQIIDTLGGGDKYKVNITYSNEGEALETAGGIIKALPILGDKPFLVVNSDIWTDFDLCSLVNFEPTGQAHLVLVDNPDHNYTGDFSLKDSYVENSGETMYTFSGIGIYTKAFFDGIPQGKTPLAPIIREKNNQHLVTGEIHHGTWTDVGTAERLQSINNSL